MTGTRHSALGIRLILLFVSVSVFGQDPDAHRFFDKQARWTAAGSAAVFATDAAVTCRNLANGGHEDWLPTQSCAGVSAWMAGNFATQQMAAYWLHRRGHHRLERLVERFSASGSAAGIVYGFAMVTPTASARTSLPHRIQR
jgi:hypothetical protein